MVQVEPAAHQEYQEHLVLVENLVQAEHPVLLEHLE